MKNIAALLLLLFFSIYSFAQDEKSIWIDRTGSFIEPMGDYLDDDYDGIALYRENKKYGFRNSFGQVIIEARYDLAQNIGKGFVAFAYNNSGDNVIWYLFNKGGKMIHGSPFKKITSVNDAAADKASFYDGLLAVQGISSGKFGCMDTTGHLVIPELYDYIIDISDPVFYIGRDGKHGIMDKKTHKETLTKYDKILEFSEGLAAVSKKGKWGYVNYDGKEVIPAKFNSAGYFFNGQASVSTEETTSGNKIINRKGDFIENAPYSWATKVSSVYENIMIVKNENESSSLFDRLTGKPLTGFKFKGNLLFVNDYADCKDTSNVSLLINRKGEVVIKGYDGFGIVSEGIVCVYKKEIFPDASGKSIAIERSGYMDMEGHLIIPFNYGGKSYFKNGLLQVIKFDDYKIAMEKSK
jgi:hypothetical protein